MGVLRLSNVVSQSNLIVLLMHPAAAAIVDFGVEAAFLAWTGWKPAMN